MKKYIAIALVLTSFTKPTMAQDNPDLAINTKSYSTAIGLRVGGTSGITIKQFLGQKSALEGIIGIWHHGFSATLLYEQHVGTGVSGLNWYYGAGGHVAFNTGHHIHYYGHERYDYYRTSELGLGIDGIVGIEYKIRPIPIAFSFDLKPFMEFTSSGNVWMSLDPGLGIKVTF